MSQLRKGSVVTTAAALGDFTRYPTEYVTPEDGTCEDRGR